MSGYINFPFHPRFPTQQEKFIFDEPILNKLEVYIYFYSEFLCDSDFKMNYFLKKIIFR